MSEEEKLLRNLKDAGCDDETIKKFFQLRAGGRRQEQYRLFSMHRALLLDKLHVSQQMIDCLDYLVYAMKKAGLSEFMHEMYAFVLGQIGGKGQEKWMMQ